MHVLYESWNKPGPDIGLIEPSFIVYSNAYADVAALLAVMLINSKNKNYKNIERKNLWEK